MSWRYVAAVDEDGRWTVRELYDPLAWSSSPMSPEGMSRDELAQDIKAMLDDVVGDGIYLDLVTGKVVDA